MIILAIARVTYAEERLGAAVLLYLPFGAILGLPYVVWQKRRHAGRAVAA